MEVKAVFHYEGSDNGFYGDYVYFDIEMDGVTVHRYNGLYDLDCAKLGGFLDALKCVYGDSLIIKREDVADI